MQTLIKAIYRRLRDFRMTLLFSMVCLVSVSGQSVREQLNSIELRPLEVPGGLPDAFVTSLLEDHDGFLWVATTGGLIRYDGYEFKPFLHIPGDSTSISHNWVESLLLASDSTIWIGTDHLLNHYDPKTGIFESFERSAAHPQLPLADLITSIVEDRHGHIWYGTQNHGLFQYNPTTKRIASFLADSTSSEHLLNDQTRTLLADSKGFIWIGTGEPFDLNILGGGLLKFNPQTGQVVRYSHDPDNPNSLLDNRIGSLMEDEQGRIWVGTCDSGLHWYDPEGDEFIRLQNTDSGHSPVYPIEAGIGVWSGCPLVRIIHRDRQGRSWIGTMNGGINIFSEDFQFVQVLKEDTDEDQGLLSNTVWTLFEDSQERIWIGTITEGVLWGDPARQKFKRLKVTDQANNQDCLEGKAILCIYQAPSEPEYLWIGTRTNGLYRMNVNSGQATHFRHSPAIPGSISSDGIWTVFEDSDQELWIGTLQGLNKFDREKETFSLGLARQHPAGNKLSENAITTIFEDSEGYLWMGTWGMGNSGAGLNRMSKANGKVKPFPIGGAGTTTFQQSVFVIHEDRKGNLWAATWKGGLYQFDRKTETFTEHLKGIGAQGLWEDEEGMFWLAVENLGLVRYNPETRSIEETFGIKEGLPNARTYSVKADEAGHLWITTANGLARFDLATQQFTNFDRTDGLPSTVFLQGASASFQAKDGILYLGTDKGLAFFDPLKVPTNQIAPSVLIEKVEINGEAVDLDHQPLHLNYKERNISFHFLGVHFTKPEKNRYVYQCEAYDQEWIDNGTQRTVRYTNLDPGQYTFKVKSANSDGIWNDTSATFAFTIHPPWWRTWWANLLFGFSILGLIYLFYKFQVNKQLAEAESLRLRELDQLKSRLYSNITHEFRTPLTIILGVTKQIKDQVQDKIVGNIEMIHRNGQLLLQLINQMLDLSKLEAGKLNLNYSHADIIHFLKYLTESFHSVAENRAIQLHFLSDLEEYQMDYDAERLQQVFFNLLSNALKFTPEGGNIYLQIAAEENAKQIAIKVRDTGTGIPEEELEKIFDRFYQIDATNTRKGEGTGIGLAVVKELVKLMGGDVHVKSKEGKGTEFTLFLPVHHTAKNTTSTAPKVLPIASNLTSSRTTFLSSLIDAPKVLIIEDNQDVLQFISNCLSSHFQLETALDGEVGIQKAIKSIPDLIISDVMMPIKDGFEVCAILKKDRRTSHIPIILLTAKADLQSKLEGLEHGADIYLGKPFHEEELLLHLNNLLQRRESLRNHFQLFAGPTTNTIQTEGGSIENTFVEQVKEVIQKHLNDHTFTVSQLSKEVLLSSSQLHRKLTALTGYSGIQLIRLSRLNRAKVLLQDQEKPISSIAYDCGFNDPDYFSKVFKTAFGASPTEYRKGRSLD